VVVAEWDVAMSVPGEDVRKGIQQDLSDCLGLIDGAVEQLEELKDDINGWLETYPHIGPTNFEYLGAHSSNARFTELMTRLLDIHKRWAEWDSEFVQGDA
jgi:hypothetical protein